MDFALYASAGAVSGLILGTVFVGGSIALAAVLLSLPQSVAQAALPVQTVALIVAAQTMVGGLSAAYHYRDVLRARLFVPSAVAAVPASLAGAALARGLSQQTSLTVFSAVLAGSVLLILIPPKLTVSGRAAGMATAAAAGLVAGCAAGAYGLGGGFALVPAMTALGSSARAAVGNALVLGGLISAAGFAVKAGFVPVPWLAIAVVTSFTAVGSIAGARLARRIPPRMLRWAILGALLAVSAHTLAQAVGRGIG